MERPELITALARTTGPVVVIFVLLGWFLQHSGQLSERSSILVMALGIPVGLLAGFAVWYLTASWTPDQAEREYLATRGHQPSAEQEFAIGNGLIDLYRARGQLGRELAELARFADRFSGTEAGEGARRALRERKATQDQEQHTTE